MSNVLPGKDGVTRKHSGLFMMGLAALGVVFGDIGTSPLYTFKIILALSGGGHSPDAILGLLSLLCWTLIIVTSLKYVSFAMKLNNNGEGGILALLSMLGTENGKRGVIVAAGLSGAALIYADSALTPAISVLSALEGINTAVPWAQPFVLPATLSILIILFCFQFKGTEKIGHFFGPIIAVWFISLAVLGVIGIAKYPGVLAALNPWFGIRFLLSNGFESLIVLGGVFLCVTGAEALYADMGHFGLKPIRITWFLMVLPGLFLNYAGQAALVLSGTSPTDNLFYGLCPEPLLIPLVILSTLATIIASQAMITGAFSMTRQAILLGWLPRLRIVQTSPDGYGQIYISFVNRLLMVATAGLVLFFQTSSAIASAYGIAVSLTMLFTSLLLYVAMRQVWQWPLWSSLLISGCFILVDAAFVTANMLKVIEGGYIPLLIAIAICSVMVCWHRGVRALSTKLNERQIPVPDFFTEIGSMRLPRVAGTAIFLTRTVTDTPPVMLWHVKRSGSLHQNILALNIVSETSPWVNDSERIALTELAPAFWRATVRFGFMEQPDIPKVLKQHVIQGKYPLDLDSATYYLGHEIIIPDENEDRTLAPWHAKVFALMVRNSMHFTDFIRLPRDQVVEIGRQITL